MTAVLADLTMGTDNTIEATATKRDGTAGVPDLSGYASWTAEIGPTGAAALVTVSSGITASASGVITFTLTSSHLASLGAGLWPVELSGTIGGQRHAWRGTLKVRPQVGS